MNQLSSILVLLSVSLLTACSFSKSRDPKPMNLRDQHSYANPEHIRVRHLDLDLEVSFEKKALEGSATLTVERVTGSSDAALVLDTQDLRIARVEAAQGSGTFQPSSFKLGAPDKTLGTSLSIQLPPTADRVRIHYSSSPNAAALQWLTPAQTAGKKHPRSEERRVGEEGRK